MANSIPLVADMDYQLDDCWNRIGIRGDRSCAQLAHHVHCHHCQIYADAAKRILDFYPLQWDDNQQDVSVTSLSQTYSTESVLFFRLGEQWLGLTLPLLIEVAPVQIIHSLPHRRSDLILGVSNVRGALVACLSLHRVLGVPEAHVSATANSTPRMLILGESADKKVIFPVDEIKGIQTVPRHLLHSQTQHSFSKVVLQWQGQSISVIDNVWLVNAIKRSLS
ncbi:chemotaxis protein CheW [Agitococcus lubricus]|uniref:Chemotaxis protein CheW n=1 Tax=Agitococcus lubricus TaxID=1077255 RepID=A0A2T5IVI5_9GAMM|nr:chemotaxis protein CheW [Agitococcus lubricus]PTQ87879.1 chemotaxis-related protein WspD [Agitococcus lubricus]